MVEHSDKVKNELHSRINGLFETISNRGGVWTFC
jgi:hypothetical protein